MCIMYRRNDGKWFKYLGGICITKFEKFAQEKGYIDYDTIEIENVEKFLRKNNK